MSPGYRAAVVLLGCLALSCFVALLYMIGAHSAAW